MVVLGLITTPLIIDLLVVVVFGGRPIPRQNGKLGSAVHFVLVCLCNYFKVLWIDTIFFLSFILLFLFLVYLSSSRSIDFGEQAKLMNLMRSALSCLAAGRVP